MKKALIVTALLAAGSVQAQDGAVFSANAVGYVKKAITTGFNMVANPLVAESNVVSDLFAAAPAGTSVFKFVGGSFQSAQQPAPGLWVGPLASQELVPGEGVWVQSPGDFEMVFVGEVEQGDLTVELPAGFSMASSRVPQQGALQGDLGFPAAQGLQVFQFVNGGFATSQAPLPTGAFLSDPTVAVGEAFWVNAPSALTWTRSFDVNAQ